MSVVALPDLNVLPAEALRALILAQHQQLLSRESEIAHLKLLITKLQRMQFGRKSEKLQRQIQQLELRLEELQANREETSPAESPTATPPILITAPAGKAARRALPEHLPRETETHAPKQAKCDCGGELRKLGEDVSEVLEYVPDHFKVIRHVRTKLSCTKCDCIVQAAAPSRPIERGVAGPGLLAHVLVSKYADHLPLYRQSEIYARHGVELERSTLADWVGGAHVRRKFYDLQQANASPVASEALDRIGALYAIEKEIRGRPPEERRQVRQTRSKALLASLRQWFETTLPKLSRKSDTTAAIRYALSRWDALARYCDDGHIVIDNNAAERALRAVALGRKNS